MVTSVRLSRDEHAKLKRIAARDRRSLSNQIRHLIEQEAERQENGPKAAA